MDFLVPLESADFSLYFYVTFIVIWAFYTEKASSTLFYLHPDSRFCW